MTAVKRCGFVAIMGRPNVGKSSLLNALLGKKVSITSFKPQTTRDQIMGIKTEQDTQIVFVDTPGMHLGAKKALNRQMNKIASQSVRDVNAIVFVVEALQWTPEDEWVAKRLQKQQCPVIIAINKIDLVPEKTQLLTFLQKLSEWFPQSQLVPISVIKKMQVQTIENLVKPHLPISPFYYEEDQITDKSVHFQSAEIIREKLMRTLEKEIPYALYVQIEKMEDNPTICHIHALIWVEREGQKGIIVGEGGQKLKAIGTAARLDLERFFEKKICLKLWVKVREGWSDNAHLIAPVP